MSNESIAAQQTEDIEIQQVGEGDNPAFDLIGLTDLRNDPDFEDIDGTGFDVVVIDTGLDRTHSLLDDNYQFGFDYINDDNNPDDVVNHGTHVAGIIGAEDEDIGVAPDVGLIGYKVGESRIIDNFAVNEALQDVLDEVRDPDTETNIVAVNLSFGGGFFTDADELNSTLDIQRRNLIEDLEAEGVVVVAAAGNSFQGEPNSNGDIFDASGDLIEPNQEPNLSSPAIYSTIAVGAVWQNNPGFSSSLNSSQIPGADRIAFFSQRLDTENFLFAPGVFINSTVPGIEDDELLPLSGTSQAAPHVTGAVALLQEIAAEFDVRLTPEQVRDYLITEAEIINDGDDENDSVENTGLDFPRIDIYQSAIALREDLENDNLPDPPAAEETETIPNDILAGAREVTLGSDRQPLIIPAAIGGRENNGEANPTTADVDLFRLTTPDNGILELDIDTPFADFPDSYLRLFNEAGEELFFSTDQSLAASDDTLAPGEIISIIDSNIVVVDDPDLTSLVDGNRNQDGYQPGNYGHVTDSYLRFSVERGETYYIGVSDFSNRDYDPTTLSNRPAPRASAEGQYELIATFTNNDLDGSIAQVTENIALPSNSFTAAIGRDGNLDIGNKDVDFYRLNTNQAGILEIDIDSFTEDSIIDAVDSVITLFDEDGNQLGLNDDTDTLDAQLRFQVTANQDYYAAVTGFGNQNFNPFAAGSGTGGDTGEYILNSRLLSLDTVSQISNNSINSDLVLEVSAGETISGRLGEDGSYITGARDIDIYRLVVESDQTLEIRTDTSLEFSADTFLRFFDAEGVEIASNDNENALTRGSFLEVEVEAGEEYYIGVNGASVEADNYDPLTGARAAAGSQGDYTLTIGDIPQFQTINSTVDQSGEIASIDSSFSLDVLAQPSSVTNVESDFILEANELGAYYTDINVSGIAEQPLLNN